MKTFTVTIHNTTNYGAILQAYALQQSILALGAENVIMDYIGDEESKSSLNLKKICKNPVGFFKSVFHKFFKLIRSKKLNVRKQSFNDFHKNHMILSKPYGSDDELKSNPPEADVYFTGSDQVWRFSEADKFLEAKFLNFGGPDVKRFSYAASIERLNYTEAQKKHAKSWLERFNGISLREESAAEYIKSITGFNTTRVLDPVFLLEKEKWLSIAQERLINGPYILCYQVQSSPRMQEIVDYLKKRTGLKTVAVLPYSIKWIKTDEALFDVSPTELLYLFANASIVVSASFHGAALGLEFDKTVYATARDNYCQRIKGIMELLGAGDFFVGEKSDIPLPEQFPTEIVSNKLSSERINSLEYLRNCLEEE